MGATFSDTIGNNMLGVLMDATTHVSLHTGDPSTTGAHEVAAGGYARRSVTLSTSAAQQIENDVEAIFGPATADWGIVSYYGLWDAASGGNFIAGGALDVSHAIGVDDTATLLAGAVELSLIPIV